jgi:hypothetical protein
MHDHRRAQLHGALLRMHYNRTRMRLSCMLLEECVRTVQLEGEPQAAKFDMMAPPSIIVRTGGLDGLQEHHRNQSRQTFAVSACESREESRGM